jgi:hypothetical protein
MLKATHNVLVEGAGGSITVDQPVRNLNLSSWLLGINTITLLHCPKLELCFKLTCSLVQKEISSFTGYATPESLEPLHVIRFSNGTDIPRHLLSRTDPQKLYPVSHVSHQLTFHLTPLADTTAIPDDLKVVVFFSLYKVQ